MPVSRQPDFKATIVISQSCKMQRPQGPHCGVEHRFATHFIAVIAQPFTVENGVTQFACCRRYRQCQLEKKAEHILYIALITEMPGRALVRIECEVAQFRVKFRAAAPVTTLVPERLRLQAIGRNPTAACLHKLTTIEQTG